jgi:hypothetical protein
MLDKLFNETINSFSEILSVKDINTLSPIPAPLSVTSQTRAGMSALRAANKVLEKKRELGLPTGNLSDGSANLDDILWYTLIEAILSEISNESRISSAVSPGIQIVASGANAGGPVVVYGSTVDFGRGGTIIE